MLIILCVHTSMHVFHGAGERNRGYALPMTAISQKQRCTVLPLFLFSLRHMVELVHMHTLHGDGVVPVVMCATCSHSYMSCHSVCTPF